MNDDLKKEAVVKYLDEYFNCTAHKQKRECLESIFLDVIDRATQLERKRCAEIARKLDCSDCGGQGWTTEHANDASCRMAECSNCPVQVQCQRCEATGKIGNEAIATAIEKGEEL